MKGKTKRTKTNKSICSKNNKGITLIALILTIIVLLILAVVAINAVTGDGIISHAKNAKEDYTEAQANEKSTLQGYLDKLEESQLASGKIKDNLNKVLSTGGNITLEDDFGNKIKVPAGFKIITKTDTENTDLNYTADDINVTKGIVVEDGEGNQFVWIPVGTIYTNTEKTESKTITLGRYVFKSDGTIDTALSQITPEGQLKTSSSATYYFTEGKKNDTTINAHAKDIEEFVSKTNASGGYYIGRYEARTEKERKSYSAALTPVTLKANDYVYNWITQPKASERCQSMYKNKPFKSDLVNSYAWDTAIIFFQEFGDNSTYASKKSVNSSLANKGTSETGYTRTAKDVICNVYDMASNCREWSTETYSDPNSLYTLRGDLYVVSNDGYTSFRKVWQIVAIEHVSFRPVLYM